MTILNLNERFNPEHIKQYIADEKISPKVIDFLKNKGDFIMVAAGEIIDPITGEFIERGCVYKEYNGFEWHTLDIYMIEKYNIALKPEFLRLIEG